MVVDELVLPRTWWWMNLLYPGHDGGRTSSTQDMVGDELVLPRTWLLMYWFYQLHGC